MAYLEQPNASGEGTVTSLGVSGSSVLWQKQPVGSSETRICQLMSCRFSRCRPQALQTPPRSSFHPASRIHLAEEICSSVFFIKLVLLFYPVDRYSAHSSKWRNSHVVLILFRALLRRLRFNSRRHRIRPLLQVPRIPRPADFAELAKLRLLARAVAHPLCRPCHLAGDLEDGWSRRACRSPPVPVVSTAEDSGSLCLPWLPPWPVGPARPEGFRE